MFFNAFSKDNFASRRASQTGAGVAYDPESVLTGEEVLQGFTFDNSRRDWPSEDAYRAAIAGDLPVDEMILWGPRVRIDTIEPAAVDCYITPMQRGVEHDSSILRGNLRAIGIPEAKIEYAIAAADEWLADATLALPLGLL